MRDMSKIKNEITRQKFQLPSCKRKKFAAEAASYLMEMENADNSRFQQLISKLWERTQLMMCHNVSAAPPLLCKKIDETPDAYLERCYSEGGYYAG